MQEFPRENSMYKVSNISKGTAFLLEGLTLQTMKRKLKAVPIEILGILQIYSGA